MKTITEDENATCSSLPSQAVDNFTERLVTTLQSAGDGVIATDVEGRVEFLNGAAERLIGITSAAAESQPLNDVLHLEERYGDDEVKGNLVELAIMSDATLTLGTDLILLPLNGPTTQVEGEISVRTNAGCATGTVVTIRDVTARNRDELQRREQQKMRAVGQLARAVSHELNNLLTLVVGHTESLEGLDSESPRTSAIAAELQRVATSIVAVTRQLLTLSGREVLLPTAVNLNTLTEHSIHKLRSLLPEKIELKVSLAADLGTILVDTAQIEQALCDLVCHARDRMPTGGIVEVATANVILDGNTRGRHLRRFVQLTIRDSGPSLRSADIEGLFEPSWNRELGHPSGLGLFTVRNMVTAASGHLSVESSEEGGASVVVLLPQIDEDAPISSAVTRVANQGHKSTVLLVEDDNGIRLLMSNSFERRGYRVLEARDGEEALLQAELYDGMIDILITDIIMPNMDGVTLAQKFALNHPDTKILLISGCPNELAGVQKLVREGACFVQKPFSQKDLLGYAEGILTDGVRSVTDSHLAKDTEHPAHQWSSFDLHCGTQRH